MGKKFQGFYFAAISNAIRLKIIKKIASSLRNVWVSVFWSMLICASVHSHS